MKKEIPRSIFVLRNNDLGDVLVTTPLLHGLRKAFPYSQIGIGVGDWAKSLLENNPNVDQIHSVNAPWHNKQICRFPANSMKTFMEGFLYVMLSSEAQAIRKESYSHGIDVLGSRQGSWFLARTGISNRYGVKGYAGGHGWCKDYVEFKENRKVTETALEFLSLLNANINVNPRPKLYLSKKEIIDARKKWESLGKRNKKIVVAPGCGFEEKNWGNENFSLLLRMLSTKTDHRVIIVGGENDRSRINSFEFEHKQRLKILCGEITIREAAALIGESDLTVANSSVAMHLAASFETKAIICLGKAYESAALHHAQWGYAESTILGKERSKNITSLPLPEKIFDLVLERLDHD